MAGVMSHRMNLAQKHDLENACLRATILLFHCENQEHGERLLTLLICHICPCSKVTTVPDLPEFINVPSISNLYVSSDGYKVEC